MSADDRGKDDRGKHGVKGASVVRLPGAGVGRPADVRTAETTTQTSGGLAAGDPSGGPHRTPERREIDRARGGEPVKGGHDPDLAEDLVQTPEETNATPPHGDKLGDRS